MLFNSTAFLFFFVLFWLAYWAVQSRQGARKWLIVVASYYFYGSWDWRFLSLIVASTAVDFFVGRSLSRCEDGTRRRHLVTLSLLANLGMLGVFKYFDFFAQSLADLFAGLGIALSPLTLEVVLPVGISFYTFQTLTYTIDIYRRELEPTDDFVEFAAFVAFFPQLVAGPIERASHLLPQIARPASFDFQQVRDGAMLALWGLFTKVLIADRLAAYVDPVFADVTAFGAPQLLLALGFFSIQIYCDFSGYSNIARGISKMLGIELMVNFDRPYFSTSLRQFWRRWHISLSSWFRDYLYIPLGGGRLGEARRAVNLAATMIVSGLWHGAAYTFVIWGAVHALGSLLDPFTRRSRAGAVSGPLENVAGFLWTLVFVNLAWAFFRADSVSTALMLLSRILSPAGWMQALSELRSPLSLAVGMSSTEFVLSFYLIGVLLGFDYVCRRVDVDGFSARAPAGVRWALSWFLLLHLLLMAPSSTGAFIYFQF